MNYREALNEAAKKLRQAGLEQPAGEARLLMGLLAGQNEAVILAHPEKEVPGRFHELWNFLVEKRAQRVPLAYLAGEKEFYGLKFKVNRWTLVPRPETETLVEAVLKLPEPATVVDIGTGCGCIAISLLKTWRRARGVVTDVSRRALMVARINASTHGVVERLEFLSGTLLKPLQGIKIKAPWILTANLPYLDVAAGADYIRKCPELRYEPAGALYASGGGLELYYRLLRQAERMENKPEKIFLEINPEQVADLLEFIAELGGSWVGNARAVGKDMGQNGKGGSVSVKIHKDLGGRERVVEIDLKK